MSQAWAAGSNDAGKILPLPEHVFQGKMGLTVEQSTGDWPQLVEAPKGAPNVLLIMTDDEGFFAASPFGGPVQRPTLETLAQTGVRFNEFHTTGICSATRAALLTGRNHHAVGVGTVIEMTSPYPGYWSKIPRSAATVARILRDNGYSTAMIGKDHNVPNWQPSASGPFDSWPTGRGFDYFFGFLGGDGDQWHPNLFRNTSRVTDNVLAEGETLDHALADDAIKWIHNQ